MYSTGPRQELLAPPGAARGPWCTMPLLAELIPPMAGCTINMSVLTDLGSGRRRLGMGRVRSLAFIVPGKGEGKRSATPLSPPE